MKFKLYLTLSVLMLIGLDAIILIQCFPIIISPITTATLTPISAIIVPVFRANVPSPSPIINPIIIKQLVPDESSLVSSLARQDVPVSEVAESAAVSTDAPSATAETGSTQSPDVSSIIEPNDTVVQNQTPASEAKPAEQVEQIVPVTPAPAVVSQVVESTTSVPTPSVTEPVSTSVTSVNGEAVASSDPGVSDPSVGTKPVVVVATTPKPADPVESAVKVVSPAPLSTLAESVASTPVTEAIPQEKPGVVDPRIKPAVPSPSVSAVSAVSAAVEPVLEKPIATAATTVKPIVSAPTETVIADPVVKPAIQANPAKVSEIVKPLVSTNPAITSLTDPTKKPIKIDKPLGPLDLASITANRPIIEQLSNLFNLPNPAALFQPQSLVPMNFVFLSPPFTSQKSK